MKVKMTRESLTGFVKNLRSMWGFPPYARTKISDEWIEAIDAAADVIETLTGGPLSDIERVQHMEKCNWKPASTYWMERAVKAEQALKDMEHDRDKLRRERDAACKVADGYKEQFNQTLDDLDEAIGMQDIAYSAGYYQAECNLPEHAKPADALAEYRELRMLPEKLRDTQAALAALQDASQGFADAVRQESGKAYPWPALELAGDMVQALNTDAEGFIVWEGGDRPVDLDVVVAVKVAGGIPRVPVRAGDWPQICWRHRPATDAKSVWNIIAYKVE